MINMSVLPLNFFFSDWAYYIPIGEFTVFEIIQDIFNSSPTRN